MTFEFDERTATNKNSPTPMTNKNNKNDMRYAIYYMKILLECIGIWPLVKKKSKKSELISSVVLITVCTLLMAFVMVPCILHVLMREKKKSVKIKLLGPIGLRLTNIVKYYSIIYRRKTIASCLKHVEKDWLLTRNQVDREIMTKNAAVGRRLTILCILFMFSGGLSYHTIMPIFRGKKIDSANRTIRPLVYPGYDIFVDSQSSPEYEIIFYTTCVSACATYAVITAICGLAAIFVSHACGQIQIIVSRLDSLFDDVDDDQDRRLKNRLSFVIRCHVRVLRLSKKIEKILSEICLMEVVASTLIICLLEYYCMTEWENSDTVAIITYFLLLISLSFNIFIFCHIGELLKEQCTLVGKAIYMIDWYRLPTKTGRALIMVITMANYPRKLTAGRMIDLSVASFGAIIKTSIMYLNMLRAVEG